MGICSGRIASTTYMLAAQWAEISPHSRSAFIRRNWRASSRRWYGGTLGRRSQSLRSSAWTGTSQPLREGEGQYPTATLAYYGRERVLYQTGFSIKYLTDLAAGKRICIMPQGFAYQAGAPTPARVREWASQAVWERN